MDAYRRTKPLTADLADMEGNGHQRELGQFFQEVKELRHDYQNIKMVVTELDQNQRNLERELMGLRSDLKAFQAKIMALSSAAIAVFSAGAWAIQLFWK